MSDFQLEPATGDYEVDRQRHVKALVQGLAREVELVGASRETLAAVREERLRALLEHARERSSWHGKRLASLDLEAIGADDLRSLPSMTKSDLMDHWDEIVCDPRLTLAGAKAHLERLSRDGPAYWQDSHHVLATGGTTGRRAVMVWDFEGFRLIGGRQAASAFWLRQNGFPEPDGPSVVALVGAENPIHGTSAIFRCFTNDQVVVVHNIAASRPIDEIARQLAAIRVNVLAGYASRLYELAQLKLAGKLDLSVRAVSTGGEPLLPEARECIEQAFGTPVRDSWGATELGITASSYPGCDDLVVCDDLMIIEPVDAKHRPVPFGERADRVLVTNLVNRVLPIIRYEISDRMTVLPPDPDCPWQGHRIRDIRGRVEDSFHYSGGAIGGALIHPHTFRTVLTEESAIVEYQVRQTPRGADIAVRTEGQFDTEPLAARLRAALIRAGLAEAVVSVECVDHIERHPQSQKLKRFVPLAST